MPRRRRRQDSPDEAVGIIALVMGGLMYRQLSAVSTPWKIALAVLITSILGTLIVWAVRSAHRRRKQQLLLADALHLTPTQFEERVQYLLQDLGWERVERSGGSGDGGVDLRGIDRGQRVIVQCKRYRGRVDPKYLRDLEGARHHERADRALLVTTGRFTRQGSAWVRGKPIELWDGSVLAARMAERQRRLEDPERQQRARRRTRSVLGSLAAVNAMVLLWAALSGPVVVPADDVADTRAPRPTPEALPDATRPIEVRQPEPGTSCGTATISGVERLVLRDAPGLQSEKLGDYPAGTVVTLRCDAPIEADQLVWQPVRVADQDGWMSRRMLK